MKNKKYLELWYDLKYFIAFKYGINYNTKEINELLKEILDYMEKLEKKKES